MVVVVGGGAVDGREERVTNRRWYDLLDKDIVHIFEQDLVELDIRVIEGTPWYMVWWGMANDMQFIDKHTDLAPKVLDLQLVAETVGEPKGLGPFVHKNVGVELDKSQQRTDWQRRPPTEAQIIYSMGDAEWLPHIYDLLKGWITDEHWVRSRTMYLENRVRVHIYKPREYGVGDKPEEWQAIQKWLWERREEEARKCRRAEE